MKKIMKKALSLALALVMMLSLAPMTTNAAVGDSTVVKAQDTVTTESAYSNVEITGTASVYGKVVVTIVSADPGYAVGCVTDSKFYDTVYGTTTGTAEFVVKNGETYSINLYGYNNATDVDDFSVATITYKVDFVELEAPKLGSQENPVLVEMGMASATVESGETAYISYTGMGYGQYYYRLNVTATATNYTISDVNAWPPSSLTVTDSTTATYVLKTGWSGNSFLITITNNTDSEQTYNLTAEQFWPEGMSDTPIELETLGSTTVTIPSYNNGQYYYTYEATEAGTFTITIDEDSLETCDWGICITDVVKADGYDMEQVSSFKYEDGTPKVMKYVEEGDVVSFYVYDGNCGTITFNTAITDEVIEDDNDDDNNGDNPGDLGGEDDVNYYINQSIVAGESTMVVLDSSYDYNLFLFKPEEGGGEYRFEVSDGTIGFAGTTYYIANPVNGSEWENTLEYTIYGGDMYVGVTGATNNIVTITVTKLGEVNNDGPTVEVHENVITPVPYVFTGNFDALCYVDLTSDADTLAAIVEGIYVDENGYFYLYKNGPQLGPQLLVNLNETAMSLMDAASYGQLSVYHEVIKYSYNEALLEYAECADEETSLYPLTVDLWEILYEVGFYKDWYGEDGWLGVPSAGEGGWLYACYFEMKLTSTVPNDDAEVSADDFAGMIEDLKEMNAQLEAAGNEPYVSVEFTTESGLIFEFVIDEMEVSDDVETYNFAVELVTDFDDATEDNAVIDKDKFVLRVNFAHEGKLPGAATITIPVGTEYADKTLYYYEILEDGTLKYTGQKAVVNAAGNFIIKQDHCSDYVISAVVPAEELPPAGDGTVAPGGTTTGDSSSIALWIAILGLGVVALAGSVVMRKREF